MPENKCVCLICGTEFFRYPSNIANGEGKYCSRKCMHQGCHRSPSPKRNGCDVACKECGKIFHVSVGRSKNGRGKYCSKVCMANAFKKCRGKDNHSYKGEGYTFISKNGNREALFVRNTEGAFMPDYRVIAEKALGRPLKASEQVHHIDMNPQNNNNSNLLICDKTYHKWLEGRYARRFAELHLGR